MFVGFSAEQKRLSDMLESLSGLVNGRRDALTRFTLSGTQECDQRGVRWKAIEVRGRKSR